MIGDDFMADINKSGITKKLIQVTQLYQSEIISSDERDELVRFLRKALTMPQFEKTFCSKCRTLAQKCETEPNKAHFVLQLVE